MILSICMAMGTDHGVGVQRAALLDRSHALQGTLHEAVVDRFLDQRARRAGQTSPWLKANSTKPSMALSRKASSSAITSSKKMLAALATQLQRGGDQVAGSGLGDHAARGGRTGEGDLGDALAAGQRHASFAAKAVDDVEHARRQQVGDHLARIRMEIGVDSAGFSTTQLPAARAGASFQAAIRMREVPRDDLTRPRPGAHGSDRRWCCRRSR